MDAAAEGDVAAGVPGDVELAGVGEDGGIPVGRAEYRDDSVAHPDAGVGQVEVGRGVPRVELHRAVEAEDPDVAQPARDAASGVLPRIRRSAASVSRLAGSPCTGTGIPLLSQGPW